MLKVVALVGGFRTVGKTTVTFRFRRKATTLSKSRSDSQAPASSKIKKMSSNLVSLHTSVEGAQGKLQTMCLDHPFSMNSIPRRTANEVLPPPYRPASQPIRKPRRFCKNSPPLSPMLDKRQLIKQREYCPNCCERYRNRQERRSNTRREDRDTNHYRVYDIPPYPNNAHRNKNSAIPTLTRLARSIGIPKIVSVGR